MEFLPGTNRIIYPQEIWSGNIHRRAQQTTPQPTKEDSKKMSG
jgi:hypothetical protein